MTTIPLGTVIEVLPDPAPVNAMQQILTWELDSGAGFMSFENPDAPFYEALTSGKLRVTETISDGVQSLSRILEIAVVESVIAPPVVVTAPVIVGAAAVGQILTVTEEPAFDGTPALEIARQWQRDTGTGWTDIVGRTGQSYALSPEDAGADVAILYTATNGAGSATVRSNPIGKIQVAAGLPALPPLVAVFDSNDATTVSSSGGRVIEWRNAVDPANAGWWTASSTARRPAHADVFGRRAIHFDTTADSAPMLEYPTRTLAGAGGASVPLHAGAATPFTHSICFMPTGFAGLRYIVSCAGSATARRMFVLYHDASGNLHLRLMQDDGAPNTFAAGFTTLVAGMAPNVPYAITLRKNGASDVDAFVGGDPTPIRCGVGTLSLLPTLIRMGQASAGTTAFEGYVFDWIAEPDNALDNAGCAARNALLLSRAVLP
jgi:hypothetical protein